MGTAKLKTKTKRSPLPPFRMTDKNNLLNSEENHSFSKKSTSLLLSETPLEILSRIPQAQLSTFLLSSQPLPLLFSVHTSRTTTSSATNQLPNESNLVNITRVDKSF